MLNNQKLFDNLLTKKYFIDIYKSLGKNDDLSLFLTNKTKFYYIKRKNYLKRRNKKYDESNLKTFQDKLNYLMIHESPEYKARIADKIRLSEYSKKILGKDLCIPIIKIYNNANEINLNELPEQFVIKCNHGSNMNIFCQNKTEFDINHTKFLLNKWMKTNYALGGMEFQYYFIKRKIFVSPYLGKLIDYKIFCFNGKPKYIGAKIILDFEKHKCIYNYYDINWRLTEIDYGNENYKRDPNRLIEKPKNLPLLIEYAEKLSKEFVFVRVDFYEIKGKVYLGELTFSPSNNGMPFKDYNQSLYLGSLLDITKIKKNLFNN